jgi:pimeloyl-ACP methyl ester carboxylesterase
MKENIIFNGVEIFFRQSGDKKAIPVVLLHGYLESMEIWNGFAEELAKQFYVVTIDLPGHGKSGVFSRNHRMDDMAEAVLAVTNHLKIVRFHLVGHTMGVYVT